MYQEINEPIETAVHFKSGKANPLAFRWHGRLFKISAVNLHHRLKLGRDVVHAYAVSTDQGDVFKISFNSSLLTWRLDQICGE